MKRSLNLKEHHFNPLKELPPPLEVKIDVSESLISPGLKKNTSVSTAQLLALPLKPQNASIHASISGCITEINAKFISIKAKINTFGNPPSPINLDLLYGIKLQKAVKNLGLPVPLISDKIKTLVINALNSQPLNTISAALWFEHQQTLKLGLTMALRLYPQIQNEVIIVKPANFKGSLGGYKSIISKNKYPASLAPLVKKTALKIEDPKAEGVLSLRYLYCLGRLARLGLPLTTVPVNLAGANYFVPLGTLAKNLLKTANLSPQNGDLVIFGGIMQGRALANLNIGLNWDTEGVYLLKGETYQPNLNFKACFNCGRCLRNCPAGLNPKLIADFVEEFCFEKIKKEEIVVCFECGLCSYHCLSGRPLIAFLKTGKKYFNLKKSYFG